MLLAHGVGGRQDLPIPLPYVAAGAVAALLISFAVLGLRWREARLDGAGEFGLPLPDAAQRIADAPATAWALRLVGLVLTGYFLIGLVAGPDVADNPTAGVLYVLFWVGVPLLSVLLGPVWRTLNPLRTLHLLGCLALRRDPARGLRELPAGLGYRPAALGLLAFVWLELAGPERASTRVIGGWLAAYAIVMLVAAVVHGARWFDRGDAFEVYSDVVGRLAPIGRRADGVLVLRNPLDGVAGLRPAPGLAAVVVVLLGSTLFDSLSGAPAWLRYAQESGLPRPLVDTAGLLTVLAAVGLAYFAATVAAARLGGRPAGVDVPGELAHSLVPIALGYVVAHYFSLLVLEGQRTVALLSDPLVTGTANWLGTAGREPDAGLLTPSGIANLQVTMIVLGHLLGAVLAHDRALALLPPRSAVSGQVPLLLLMVVYTATGLFLLYAG